MISQKSIQPVEMVFSAIHCLKEKKGSSPKEILKYFEEKYNVCAEAIKTEVEDGLKNGVSFGLLSQKGGLYCLREILSSPLKRPEAKSGKSRRIKIRKNKNRLKRLKLDRLAKKTGSMTCALKNRKKKAQGSKTRRKTKLKKITKGRKLKRQTDVRRRKRRCPKCQKFKPEKTHKSEKAKTSQAENALENYPLKFEGNSKV